MTILFIFKMYLLDIISVRHSPGASLGGSDSKEFACNARDLTSVPWWGRSPGERSGQRLMTLGLLITRELPTPQNINRQAPSQRPPSQH